MRMQYFVVIERKEPFKVKQEIYTYEDTLEEAKERASYALEHRAKGSRAYIYYTDADAFNNFDCKATDGKFIEEAYIMHYVIDVYSREYKFKENQLKEAKEFLKEYKDWLKEDIEEAETSEEETEAREAYEAYKETIKQVEAAEDLYVMYLYWQDFTNKYRQDYALEYN